MKQSDTQFPALHTSPAPQPVPSLTALYAEVDADGVHTWQLLLGFRDPPVTTAPPIKQSDAQVPETQISPAPQLVPSLALL
jgi:hypothetical protein